MVLPTAAFPSSSAALKAGVLLGFALQHGLLASGIPLSHNLLTKSRWIWGGCPDFRIFSQDPSLGKDTAASPKIRAAMGAMGKFIPQRQSPSSFQTPLEWALQMLLVEAFACSGFRLAFEISARLTGCICAAQFVSIYKGLHWPLKG